MKHTSASSCTYYAARECEISSDEDNLQVFEEDDREDENMEEAGDFEVVSAARKKRKGKKTTFSNKKRRQNNIQVFKIGRESPFKDLRVKGRLGMEFSPVCQIAAKNRDALIPVYRGSLDKILSVKGYQNQKFYIVNQGNEYIINDVDDFEDRGDVVIIKDDIDIQKATHPGYIITDLVVPDNQLDILHAWFPAQMFTAFGKIVNPTGDHVRLAPDTSKSNGSFFLRVDDQGYRLDA